MTVVSFQHTEPLGFSYRGKIPAGLNVLHKCDTPRCVNPGHLFLGTHADNMKDKAIKGRASIPKKLTMDQVVAIRNDSRLHKDIATDFGVSRVLVCNIKNGKRWRPLCERT